MNLAPIWRGTRATTERNDSPRIVRSTTGWHATRIYEGVFDELVKNAPAAGATMADMGALEVEEVEIVPIGGGLGMMTVQMASDSTGGIDSVTAPVYEIEWLEVQKDISRHPRYQSSGECYLTEDEAAILRRARQGDTEAISYVKAHVGLNGGLGELWGKIVAGNEDYVEYIPVVTETVVSRSRPSDSNAGAGFIDSPPSQAGAPGGWQWLRTAAPTTRQGLRWNRRRQWTGAKKIDRDLY